MNAGAAHLAESPVPGILASQSGQQILANAAWDALAGGGAEDWLKRVHPDDRGVAESLARRGGERHEIRLVVQGTVRRVVAASFACAEGHLVWFLELDAEREDVLRSLQRERELNDLKNRFISVVSHEFRTPLTVILSSAELLEHYGSKWPEERRGVHFRKIHTAVGVMTTLLDNVGLYGRAESGALEFSLQSFAPGALLAELVAEARGGLPAGQEIRLRDDSGTRPLASDPKLLRYALANLLSNAVRFSPKGTPIEVSCSWDGDAWSVWILDLGIGLPPEDAERVWERFQRGSNIDGIPGTGLGLPIVRRCADMLAARASLAAREGGGCAARLVVPDRDAAGSGGVV